MPSYPNRKSDTAKVHPGDRVGAYRIERELGSGGMADVYYAIHLGLERPSALKILRPSLATDKTHLQRFLQEAKAAASLVHPNIVQVYDVGQDGELRYIAQEYIPGSNLRQFLSNDSAQAKHGEADNKHEDEDGVSEEEKPDRQLEIQEVLSIVLQILAALNKSAASGIVHRDIKPENIMLTPEGDVKVADFGLARLLRGDDPQLTRAGTTLGTPMYMSPEQIQEGKVDIRSDLYSLGVTLYHMLTGRPPFTGETPLALAMQHVQAAIPDLRRFREHVPDSIVQLVERLLAKDPEDRFANPQQIIEFLRQHRKTDLTEYWPEQTIPLPGAAINRRGGPLHATLLLEAALRKKRMATVRGVLAMIAGVVLMIAAFVCGNAFTYSSPVDLLSIDNPPQIDEKESVQEQYRWALFDTKANRIAKWEAVAFYFPKDATELNRLYAGLADLQLARAYRETGDTRRARGRLNGILDDAKAQSIVKAYAYLEIARIEDEADNTDKVHEALSNAKKIREGPGFNARDREQLDAAVELMPSTTQMLWFDLVDS